MADRYWVGGTGTWNTTSTTNWSASSGGTSGASVPTSADNVFFDQAGTYTVTMTGALACKDWTVSAGTVTFANGTTPTFIINGNLNWTGATVSASLSFSVSFSGAGSKTINTAGQTLGANPISLQVSGASYTLGAAFVTTANLVIGAGVTFNTAGYAFTSSAGFAIGVGAGATLNLGASLCTFTGVGCIGSTGQATAVINASASSIVNSSTGAVVLISSGYPAVTFGSVSFTGASATSITINQANTFSTLSFAGRTTVGITPVTFNADQTISTLTLNAGTAAAYRTFLTSDAIGTQRTLSVGTLTAGAADYDFRDIAITGAAAPITVTRAGDCKNNSGITFSAAKTVYYRQTGSANWGATGTGSWAATSGGSADATQFPLAQDIASFPAATYPASGSTTTINANYNIGTIDMSARTSNTMTLATGTTTLAIYGDWINGTGTALTGTSQMTFAGRGSQTITSAGKTFSQRFLINSPSGSVTLIDAFTCSNTSSNVLSLTTGTFDANGYAVTFSSTAAVTQFGTAFNGTLPKTLAIGSGTWTLAGSGTVWSVSGSNLTVTGTGTINLTSASAKTFNGNSIQTYPTINQGGTGSLTISGSNKFINITNTAVGSVLFTSGTTNEFSAFNLNGAAGNLLTLGATTTSQATLKKPSSWLMGANSTDGGNNTGLSFSAGGGIDYLNVSYINGQTTVTYTGAGNFFPFFS